MSQRVLGGETCPVVLFTDPAMQNLAFVRHGESRWSLLGDMSKPPEHISTILERVFVRSELGQALQ